MSRPLPRILLLSAYDAASHRYWCQWLQHACADFHWTCLSLPDRHFYWRIRSNALTFVGKYKAELAQPYDLIIATSMTDLATLRGLVPALGRCPAIVYFHENQFVYPLQTEQHQKSNIINAQLNSILTATAADVLVFNSAYNQSSFMNGLQAFSKRMPDGIDKHVPVQLAAKSQVLPVPIIQSPQQTGKDNATVEIVWNHRWEYDKQPDVFFAAMSRLQQEKLPFKLHVMGQSFRQVPSCFDTARKALGGRIITWGYQPRERYCQILERAAIVVSTALHDFQGLSMLEAIHRGCVPVAPDRVAYPEYIPAALLYNGDNEVESLCDLLHDVVTGQLPQAPLVDAYLDTVLTDKYRKLIDQAIQVNT
ncbi:MAG: DUF3524 domain-containing protein [Pseudomonadota bacterium]